ncbi:hypothetical protein CR203_19020 [Salipaludibacillus neizhouensis]|uniref:DinB-like domain-containing protein n=1 Tax=Salipaludibacillus neizhouensis TaxID=885475 RepID=A0A3A9K5K0_9BACI|nr:DinB family protein [Salipaludibacillus neizhouensis]RKL65742.1 hypothetical protein CR203_19020 [Salipaludibacillus neizhouensis]
MSHYLIEQFKFARMSAINYVKDLNGNQVEAVPTGLNNNIKWNLGHQYVVVEKFAFLLTGEKAKIPANFQKLFNPGTSPKDWSMESPKKDELIALLTEQMKKVESLLSDRLEDPIENVYKTSTGLEISSVGGCLSFCLYHEGMHFGAIKHIKQLSQK